MKIFKSLILLAVMFVSSYAFAQIPSCPCDDVELLPTGLTGNEIVDILCPGGELGEGTEFVLAQNGVEIFSDSLIYIVIIDEISEIPGCGIIEIGETSFGTQLSDQDYEACRQRLIQGCNLQQISPIPTLSEWGLIAMAGVLGIIGLVVAARRRKAAA